MTKTMHVIPSKGKKVVGLTMQEENTEEWERKEARKSKSSRQELVAIDDSNLK